MFGKWSAVLILGVLAVSASSAWAGALAGDPLAYFDGVTTWHGTTVMTGTGSSAGFSAAIDWCVYGPGDYPGSYVAAANEFVYAYQIFVTGAEPLAKLTVGMLDSNEANDISNDATLVAGEAPSSAYFLAPPPNLDSAIWEFTSLIPGDNSDGLVYSSVNAPLMFFGSIQDTGKYADGELPSPSDVIPEPMTMSLLLAGLAGLSLRRRS